jgi:hypothetical protein
MHHPFKIKYVLTHRTQSTFASRTHSRLLKKYFSQAVKRLKGEGLLTPQQNYSEPVERQHLFNFVRQTRMATAFIEVS